MTLTTKHLIWEDETVFIGNPSEPFSACGMVLHDGRDDCRWPPRRGAEPDWFETEVADLVNKINDYIHYYEIECAREEE